MAQKRLRGSSPSDSQKRHRSGAPQYVVLGTELPDEGGDDGAFVPVWKQTVTDEQGRRRLHGAFTGGFSAGYFNTVGSKEGWTPKTFVSSRSNRNKEQPDAAVQRAEDFMDAEDLADAAESRQLETTQTFAGIGGRDAQNEGLFGLFMTQEDTMGVKIAQKMGWRKNQGIGRKIRRSAHLEDQVNGGSDSTTHMFAPKDNCAMKASQENPKRKGLGYISDACIATIHVGEPAESSVSNLQSGTGFGKRPTTKKASLKKSSFGVGVLNDTGSDDEDPYELGPKISFNKTIGKDKKAKKPSKFARSGLGDKCVYVPQKDTSKALVSLSKASMDGRPPLDGFVLATKLANLSLQPRYTPPSIPSDWKSALHPFVDKTTQHESVADAAKNSNLDTKARSALLGEVGIPGKSIFDFIPKEARDRLAALSGKSDLPQGLGQAAPEGHLPASAAQPKDLWSMVPALEKSVAAAALIKGATGWKPYAEDMGKQDRYTGFLEMCAGLKNNLPERVAGVSTSEWVKELQEFAHAAQVFKPTTGIMASRFKSSCAAASSTSETESKHDNFLRQPVSKPEDPAEQAAKLGMFGAMTRSSFPFHPSRLLCKRFNVKPPPDMAPSSHEDGTTFKSKTEEAVSKNAMDKMMHEILTNGPALQRPAWMGQVAPLDTGPLTVKEQIPHATVDVERNHVLEQGRASEDVFKAIFGDSDDD